MLKRICFIIFYLLFFSCEKKESLEKKINITIKFTHNWDETQITPADFNQLKFINANGETLSIEQLRYLVSNISLENTATKKEKAYHLVNLGEAFGLELTFENNSLGIYEIKFRFGFMDADNTNGIYQDLNSVSFNVPRMLGGGYHYMQFDGKYLNSSNLESNFNYHVIRAVDRTNPNDLVLEDTSFLVNLGSITITNNAIIEVKMNVAEWFKNPHIWNLNDQNSLLMQNIEAQKQMNANGKSVFSLGQVTQ